MLDPDVPVHVFTSYAHADEPLRERLDAHLAALRRHPAVTVWNDRGIDPGDEWDAEIRGAVREADVILLLVSAAFLASDYIHTVELAEALSRHERGEAVVVPVVLKPCHWQVAAFAKLQALPRNALPVSQWPDEDEALAAIAEALYQTVARVQARKRAAS